MTPINRLVIFISYQYFFTQMNAAKASAVCKKCRAYCCRLGGPDFTKEEMKRVLKAGHPDYFVKIGRNHHELRVNKGICPYLKKDNSCLIQKVKPPMCRSWPVDVEYEKNKKAFSLIKCPLTPLLSKQDIRTMKKQAGSTTKDIIKNSSTHSKLPESDIALITKRFYKLKMKPLD